MAGETKYILYHYNPSFVAAVIFIVLFITTTTAHTYQLLRRRTWYFIPFLIGGFCKFPFSLSRPHQSFLRLKLTSGLVEIFGYIGRAINSKQTPNWTTGPYIMQSLLLLLAPTFFAASIYMILGRIILLTDGETHSLIRARWLTKLFVAGDVLSFFAQSAGTSSASLSPSATTSH